MTEASYTPGPWFKGPTIAGYTAFDYAGTDAIFGEPVCWADFRRAADERLALCAPELLECLKLAATIIGHPDDSTSKLIAETIAKAEGRK